MARYLDDARYEDNNRFVTIERVVPDRPTIVPDNTSQIDQVTTEEVGADQNNYSLPPGELIRLSTDASRNFTGFVGARPGIFALCNVGLNDVVIVNDSASSDAENRVLCHTGGNITLNPGESLFIIYDFESSRWRTIGFA